jgi:hypothetical protein
MGIPYTSIVSLTVKRRKRKRTYGTNETRRELTESKMYRLNN